MLQDRKQTGWEFYGCPIDTEADLFGTFAPIVDLWRNRRTDTGPVACRSSLDFYDFVGWHGRIFIAKFSEDPFDVTFTLWGTELVDWWGVEYTNKKLGQHSKDPEVWRTTELAYFKKMRELPFIGLSGGTLEQHGHPNRLVTAVDLPLCDSRRVTHVMGFHQLSCHSSVAEALPPALWKAQRIHRE